MNKNSIAPSDSEEGRPNSPTFNNNFGSSFCTIIETETCDSVISTLSTETEYNESFDLSASLPSELSRDTTAVAESLSVMIQKEQTFYKCQDYLGKSRSSAMSSPEDTIIITPSDRTKIVEWCYDVVDQCQLDREAVACAMNMVDRFFSNGTISSARHYFLQDRKLYQLLAVTALYMSIKIHEHNGHILSSDFFAEISTGRYNKEQIEAAELMMLKQLEYRLSAPTSIQISNHILSLLLPFVSLSPSTWDFILEEVAYQNECTVFDYYFSTQPPSTVAMASIYNTLEHDHIDERDRQVLLRALMLVENAHDFGVYAGCLA